MFLSQQTALLNIQLKLAEFYLIFPTNSISIIVGDKENNITIQRNLTCIIVSCIDHIWNVVLMGTVYGP